MCRKNMCWQVSGCIIFDSADSEVMLSCRGVLWHVLRHPPELSVAELLGLVRRRRALLRDGRALRAARRLA